MPPSLTASSNRSSGELTTLVAAIAICAILPFLLYPIIVMKMMCFALLAAAFNLLFGYAGLLAFGHAAFFGTAAYVTAYTAKTWQVTPEIAVLLGGAASAALGLVFGWVAIRRQGLYFAMITLSLAQIVYFYAIQAPWTGGEDGLRPVPRGHLFGFIDLAHDGNLYIFVAAVTVIGFMLLYRTVYSPFGEVLRSIRDNEQRAISLGYDVNRFKLIAFVLSAALSGVAGGLKSIVFQIATLSDVHFAVSADVLLMLLIGGIGTVLGPVVGAVVYVGLQNYLAALGSWVMMIQGAVFVLCILLFRQGIVGTLGATYRRRVHRQ